MRSPLLNRNERSEAEAVLRSQGLMATMPPDLQDKVFASGEWRRVPARQPLFRAGDDTSSVQGIASGVVALETSVGGPEMTLVDVVSAPFWFGGQPQVDGTMRWITATARTEVLVFSVPPAIGNMLLYSDQRLFVFVLQLVTRLFWNTMTALADSVIPDSRLRCVATLLRIGGRRNADTSPVTLPISQTDLSQLCNLSRQTSGDVLRGLEAEGLVTLGYRSIRLNDPARLRALGEFN
jgi:CRP-like cAMP-binding protein